MADNRYNRTTAPLHTGGDFYEYGGITRSVVLHQLARSSSEPADTAATPATPAFFKDVGVKTSSAGLAHVDISLRLGGAFNGEAYSVAFNGQRVSLRGTITRTSGDVTLAKVAVAHEGGSAKPAAWSSDTPNLHNVTITLAGSGDAVTARFGLRVLGVNSGGRLTINGKATKLKGYNRHTMSPTSGSALTLKEVQRDVDMLVDVGANFVRGAHYPQDQRFLDLCDEHGFFDPS